MKKNIVSYEYKIASTEVLTILEYLPEEIVKRIPEKFKEFLKINSMSNYKPQFDFSMGLDKIELKKKTKLLLAMVYRNFICSYEKRKEYDIILGKNEENYQRNIKK